MIDLTPYLTQAQISFGILLIAAALVYYVLNRYPLRMRPPVKKKKKKR